MKCYSGIEQIIYNLINKEINSQKEDFWGFIYLLSYFLMLLYSCLDIVTIDYVNL